MRWLEKNFLLQRYLFLISYPKTPRLKLNVFCLIVCLYCIALFCLKVVLCFYICETHFSTLSVCLSICLPLCLFVCLSLSVYLPACLSVCLSVYLSVCLSLSLSLSFSLSLSLSLSLSVYFSPINKHNPCHLPFL